MKRPIAFTLCLSLLITLLAACGTVKSALPSVTEEIFEDCFLTITLDSRSYKPGDTVVATVTAENRGRGYFALSANSGGTTIGENRTLAARMLLPVGFKEGDFLRRSLIPAEVVAADGTYGVLEQGETLTRVAEISLASAENGYDAPAAAADWTIFTQVHACAEFDPEDPDWGGDRFEYKAVEISVPHEHESDPPSNTIFAADGVKFTATLGKSYYTATEEVTARITFTNESDRPVKLMYLSDPADLEKEFTFDARVIRREYDRADELSEYSDSYTAYRTVDPGKTYEVTAVMPLERNVLGKLEYYTPADDYTFIAQVWYVPAAGDDTTPRRCAIELPVPHERTAVQLFNEVKGAYFSRIRVTLDGTDFVAGDPLPVKTEFFCIRDSYRLDPVFDGHCIKVQIMSGYQVLAEALLEPSDTAITLESGTVLSSETEFDTENFPKDAPWKVTVTAVSCAERDIADDRYEEHSVTIEVPHDGYAPEVIEE